MNPLQQHLENLRTHHRIPGLAVAVAREGRTIFEAGLGHRDVAAGLPVTPDTVFGVASVTKSFAALAIVQLEDRGRLSVLDPVVKWLPEFRIQGADVSGITIHHLLTHTSGLPGQKALYLARAASIRRDPNWKRLGVAYDPFTVDPIQTCAELLDGMASSEIELLGAPGSCFNYSNEGYAMLGEIIARASGRPFLTYMQEEILDPLHMRHSTFLASDLERFPEVTELYASVVENGQTEVIHAPVWWDVGQIYANGSLKSTVRDLLNYLEVYRTNGLFQGHRIASEGAIRKMMSPHVQLPSGKHYGYGLDVEPYHGVTLVGHGGGIKGVSSHIRIAVEPGITAVALTNLSGVPAHLCTLAPINAELGLPLETRTQVYPPFEQDGAPLSDYAGLYRSGEGTSFRFLADGGVLYLELPSGLMPLRPFGPGAFVAPDELLAFHFVREGDGPAKTVFSGVRMVPRVA